VEPDLLRMISHQKRRASRGGGGKLLERGGGGSKGTLYEAGVNWMQIIKNRKPKNGSCRTKKRDAGEHLFGGARGDDLPRGG